MSNNNTQKILKNKEIQKKLRVVKKVSRVKRKFLSNPFFARVVLGSLGLLIFSLLVSFGVGVYKNTKAQFYVSSLKDFLLKPDYKVQSMNGIVNILILGKGGAGHEAPDLTDTIILVSINKNKKKISLISFPRDIWIKELRAKINSAYYWGNQKRPPVGTGFEVSENGGGLVLAKSVAERVSGQPVFYGLVFDFDIFVKIIDFLGGVEVDVQRSFVDEKYPISGKENADCGGDREFKCRYETVEFKKGKSKMDGQTALKFVRSRNAQGEEGTDFAREARQQKVIEAIKNKLISREFLTNYKMVFGLMDLLEKEIETDIPKDSFATLARLIFDSRKNISYNVLPESLLKLAPRTQQYDYLYTFVPKSQDWKEINSWVNEIVN